MSSSFFVWGVPPLWDGDEGMHAATSKDMVLSGDWITPTLNGEKFYDKPVLYNWFVSLSFLVFGFNEFAIGYAWTIVAVRMALRKKYGDFRIVLLPRGS